MVLRTRETLPPVAVASVGNCLGAVSTCLLAGMLARRVAGWWRKPEGGSTRSLPRSTLIPQGDEQEHAGAACETGPE